MTIRTGGKSSSPKPATRATTTGRSSRHNRAAMLEAQRKPIDVAAARIRCRKFRRRILDISQQVQALHIGSAYSCTEIVDCIYFELMARGNDAACPDTFIMSKGHGC